MENYIFILVWMACAIWIYSDAKKRNLKAAASWAILGFLLGILGILGYWYFIIRTNKKNA